MAALFKHTALRLVEPSFSSSLTTLIIELDYLRRKKLTGTTHPRMFFQLKHVFHTLESIGSARIEGNNTTITEYIETKIDPLGEFAETILEIQNVEKAMEFIDEHVKLEPINKSFVSELHRIIAEKLPPLPNGEGDWTPGEYRKKSVGIAHSSHVPPDALHVDEYMEELFRWMNGKTESKYDLLKTAIAHHRFVWIHPFTNGNGRTVRLFTYAMLVKQGFQVDVGRIINPTAVFCADRNAYYDHLARADSGTDEGILLWCEYVLGGLRSEIEKVDRLLDYEYLKKEILIPAIDISRERKLITGVEAKVLRKTAEKQLAKAADFEEVLKAKYRSDVSRVITRLKEKKMLVPLEEGKRKYLLRFDNNYLLRGVIQTLDEKGFLPLHN
jgi:Fic family protein